MRRPGSGDWVQAGPEVIEPLRALRQRQIAERLKWGPAWHDTGYVHTLEDGRPYHPSYVGVERVARKRGFSGLIDLDLGVKRRTEGAA